MAESNLVRWPRWLKNLRGRPQRPPAKVRKALHCSACGARLVRRGPYWLCPDGWHGRLLTEHTLLDRVLGSWKQLRPPAWVHDRPRRFLLVVMRLVEAE